MAVKPRCIYCGTMDCGFARDTMMVSMAITMDVTRNFSNTAKPRMNKGFMDKIVYFLQRNTVVKWCWISLTPHTRHTLYQGNFVDCRQKIADVFVCVNRCRVSGGGVTDNALQDDAVGIQPGTLGCGNECMPGIVQGVFCADNIVGVYNEFCTPLGVRDGHTVSIYDKVFSTISQKRLDDRYDVFMDRDDTLGGFCFRAL